MTLTFTPLAWTKVRAGEYLATDNRGNAFLIRNNRLNGTNHAWVVYVNDQISTYSHTLASAKRHVEAIARKHHVALKAARAALGIEA